MQEHAKQVAESQRAACANSIHKAMEHNRSNVLNTPLVTDNI